MKLKVVLGFVCLTFAVRAQEFDASSFKLQAPPKDGRFMIGPKFETGQFVGEYMTLRDLILTAYPVPSGGKIEGGPEWMDSDSVRYYITAKAAGPATPKELRVMLQHLLERRLQLKLHTEDRPAPIYALIVGPKGFKPAPVQFDGDPNVRAIRYTQNGAEFQHTSMALLANFLAVSGRHVIDATDLHGVYDFKLVYSSRPPRVQAEPGAAEPNGDDGPTIFAAVQELGLKLENRQGMVPVYIVEHAEKVPSEN